MSYRFLLDIALILMSTKALGLLAKKFQMPQVVGALLAGLLLGPAVFNILNETDFLSMVSELGVIVIMFTAGIETNIKDLKKTGKAGFIIALIGVIVPLLMGAGFMAFFNKGDFAYDGNILLRNFFIGIVLTATSVSITVETLKELGKLNSKVGNTILAAAIIDDVLGLVALAIITSMAGTEVNILIVVLKIVLFFIISGILSILANYIFKWYTHKVHDKDLHRFPIAALVVCLLMAYMAEHFFGIADIIGAFIAGLVISNTTKAKYIESKMSPISYILLSPIFFASIGIKVVIPEMSWMLVGFTVLLIIIAILSKLVGCGLGARFSGFTRKESVQLGIGMVCRGEVALIVVNKGIDMGLVNPTLFAPIIIMVVLVTLLTPVFLKIVYSKSFDIDKISSHLVENYQKVKHISNIEEELLEKNNL